jgi:gluconolactonase
VQDVKQTVIEDAEVVAEGLGFPEGQVALADGSVLVVELSAGTVRRVAPGGVSEVVATTHGSPNGAQIGPDGAAYVCNNGGAGLNPGDPITPCIQRVDLDTGAVDVLYTTCDGQPLKSPNDIVFDGTGNFWFSDLGDHREGSMARGAVHYASPDGSSIRRAPASVERANGIGLSPDGDVLYWAETGLRQVHRRRIASPGELVPSPGIDLLSFVREGAFDPWVLLVGLPGWQQLDSLAVEAAGNVCVGTLVDGCVTVISTDGEVERMTPPAALADPLITNICFGGADLQTAYLTCSATGRLLSCRWPRPGLKLAYQELP